MRIGPSAMHLYLSASQPDSLHWQSRQHTKPTALALNACTCQASQSPPACRASGLHLEEGVGGDQAPARDRLPHVLGNGRPRPPRRIPPAPMQRTSSTTATPGSARRPRERSRQVAASRCSRPMSTVACTNAGTGKRCLFPSQKSPITKKSVLLKSVLAQTEGAICDVDC